MEEFKIPKIKKKVTVVLDGHHGTEQQYHLYLSTCSPVTRGEETIEELLGRGKTFLPLKEVNTEKKYFANLSRIIYLAEDLDEIPEKKEMVHIMLKNGMEVEVSHYVVLPESRSRVLDYFNSDRDFLVFLRNAQKIHLNKSAIIKAEIR